ncbi:WbuC family cupin fold metalloprotein [Escherichia coli]|uniref:WbuC family cupin fold metalloprotein n=1 Tax=Escherichia coli TaxID=562 RepID=UPI0008FF477A|nr:WbuC family cupin fold metalloprotein [Escherichia coli]EHX7973763.1 WbuC family cupin fold metalloprotein [Escherichia coli]EHX8473300.1 WbuC family cupin fold metalloprotein [Escherichia coli]EKG8000832.1 WbuC family cupin fold metalloprotein [Escherichia coli]HBB6597252.1 WbuC family cupin fold metalloprotein [Escherichia coli]HCP2531293.1 WbuC family cupin fold metalloprotein [Escherichia coli]
MKDNLSFSKLISEAEINSRNRSHLNLHESFSDPIQKTLICCCSNTYIPPHYHKFAHQSELFIRLKGCFSLLIFSVDGVLTRRITIDEENPLYEIKPGVIHTVVALDSHNILLEIKRGPYVESEAKNFPDWVTLENSDNQLDLERLRTLKVGDKLS